MALWLRLKGRFGPSQRKFAGHWPTVKQFVLVWWPRLRHKTLDARLTFRSNAQKHLSDGVCRSSVASHAYRHVIRPLRFGYTQAKAACVTCEGMSGVKQRRRAHDRQCTRHVTDSARVTWLTMHASRVLVKNRTKSKGRFDVETMKRHVCRQGRSSTKNYVLNLFPK